MKRFCLTTLLLAIVLVSCDPGYSQDYVFQNDSSHSVTIVALMDTADMYFVSPMDSIRCRYFQNPDGITIAAGEKTLLYADGGLGRAGNENTGQLLQHIIYGDSVRFEFDDGRYLYYHHAISAPHSPYDDDSYTFKGEYHRYSSEGTSTYVLTDEDYSCALKTN
jgi:hypothetical protein